MKRRLSSVVPVAVAIAALAAACHAKVAATSLGELVGLSDLIVVGRVIDIPSVEKTRVAEVEVTQVLKGRLAGTTLYLLAQPTWTCDTSTAVKGESALLFLQQPRGRISAMTYKEPPRLRARLQARKNKGPFMVIAWSGRGRMPLRTVRGENYVALPGDVRVPSSLKTIRGPRPEDLSLHRLAEVVQFIKGRVGKSQESGSKSSQVQNAAWRSAQEDDIYEAVLRRGFQEYARYFMWGDGNEGKLKTCTFFLSIKGKDPSDQFLKRFADGSPLVRKGSAAKQFEWPAYTPESFGQAASLSMGGIVWASDTRVGVDWSYFWAQRVAGSCRIVAVRKNGKWVIQQVKDHRVT